MDQNNQNLQNSQTNLPNQIVQPPVPAAQPSQAQVADGLHEFTPGSQEEAAAIIDQDILATNAPAPAVAEVQPPVPASPVDLPPASVEQSSPLINNTELVDLSKKAPSGDVSEVAQSPSFEQATAPVSPNIGQTDTQLNNSSAFNLPNNGNETIVSAPDNNQQVAFAGGEEEPKGKVWPWVVSGILVFILIIVALFYYYNITISF